MIISSYDHNIPGRCIMSSSIKIADHKLKNEEKLYDIDDLTVQALLLGYHQGKHYVLDQIGESIELIELEGRHKEERKVREVFENFGKCASWLQQNLEKSSMEKRSVKRVNANIPEALHHDFKKLCVDRKVDMQDVLAQLIIRWMQFPEQH